MPVVVSGYEKLEDEEVVARVRAGETALFEILMRRHNQRLYRAVRSILRAEQDIDDVMQQAYLSAYSHLDQFEGRARFATWLTRIGVNEALGRARKRRANVGNLIADDEGNEVGAIALENPGPSPERTTFAAELRGLLEAAIDTLPLGYREVFMLREVEGLTTSETAASLDLSEEAVKTRLHRARGLIRDRLYEATGASAAHAFQFGSARCDRLVEAVLARISAPSGWSM